MTFDELIEATDLDSALMIRDMNFKAWYCTIGKFRDQCEALEALGFLERGENIKAVTFKVDVASTYAAKSQCC